MKVFGYEVKSCDARIQIKIEERWVDFTTIKDEDDCYYAEETVRTQMFEGKPNEFRILCRNQATNFKEITLSPIDIK